MDYRILIVEDDHDISEMLSSYLSTEGYISDIASNGQMAIDLFRNEDYHLVLLDLMLPLVPGIDVLKVIRDGSQVPVLIMSAKDKDVDKAIGLGLGADDYIAKPFSMIEVVARIKAALRRANTYSKTQEQDDNKVTVLGTLVINPKEFSVTKKGMEVKLTKKEFDILNLLATHPKQVFTKAQLFSSVWKEAYYGDENVINVHIRRLREKIEDDPSSPKYILTLWGIGYKLGEIK